MMEIVLLLWMSFFTIISPLRLVSPWGFYQFLARGSNCRLVRSLPTPNRRWETEFSLSLGSGQKTLLK